MTLSTSSVKITRAVKPSILRFTYCSVFKNASRTSSALFARSDEKVHFMYKGSPTAVRVKPSRESDF